MRTTIWTLVAAAVLTASSAFAAGGAKGDFEVGIYGGYGWLDDHGDFQPKDNMLYGARLGYFLSRHWSFEGAAQQLPTKPNEDTATPGVEAPEYRFDAYRFNGLFNFIGSDHFRPFVTAGVGQERFDFEDVTTSKELGWNAGAGFRWYMTPALNLRADGRYVSVHMEDLDQDQGNVEATLGLGWTFGGGGMAAVAAAPPPAPNQPPTVTCSVDRTEILPGESVNVTATAADPEGDPLTYEWSASAGKVTGNMTTAAFDFSGAQPPANATITVKVVDSHGNTATSDCAVAMAAPKPKAEAVSCLASGFPSNTSRITNVDKACLDDVAQRLSTDPRATVTIIGYADTRERSAQRIGQQRADAVKAYLTERGVESSRITVRSAAATNPVEVGTDASSLSRNRRVEVWFVPEGTTIPTGQ